MDIDTLKMEAHYCGIINARNQMIIGLHERVLELQKRNDELKLRVEELETATSSLAKSA